MLISAVKYCKKGLKYPQYGLIKKYFYNTEKQTNEFFSIPYHKN